MTRFGITLVVLYSFTNLQLLLALENGDGSASSAPPPRSSCFPTIGGFLMGAIVGGGAVYYHCAARHKPPTTLSSTASSAVLSTTEQQSTAIQLVLFSVFFTPIMLFGCYILYLLIEERLASAEEKKAKVKPAVGPKSNIDDPKIMSTTSQVKSSANTTATGVV